MFATRVTIDDLIDILAAESYDPQLMRYVKKTIGFPKIEGVLEDKPRLGITGTIADEYVDASHPGAVPYYSTKQVCGLYTSEDDCKFITPEADKEWAKCRVPVGAIVINKSGNVGAAAIVKAKGRSYVSSVSDLINIKPRALPFGVDTEYLAVFLNSPYGQSQLQRLSGGAIFDHVSIYAIPEIRFQPVHGDVQRYIGAKVRHADRLHTEASALRAEVMAFHHRFIPSQAGVSQERKPRLIPSSFISDRLDAYHYPASVPTYLAQCPTSQSIGAMCIEVFNGATRDDDESGSSFLLQATVANISGPFPSGPYSKVKGHLEQEKGVQIHDLLMCNAAHSREFIGRHLCYSGSNSGLAPSTEVMVIRVDRSRYPASFVWAYLSTAMGYVQLQATVRGITAHSYPDDVKKTQVPIPSIPTSEKANWMACDDKMALSALKNSLATDLIESAKLLVEALIEGKVTEADLLAAANDPSKDRALLARLTRAGLDAPGEALIFPDGAALDALVTDGQITSTAGG